MIRSKQAAMTPPKEKLPSKSTAKISSTATTSNGGDMFCDVCNATFGNVDDWKKHVTSMLHLLTAASSRFKNVSNTASKLTVLKPYIKCKCSLFAASTIDHNWFIYKRLRIFIVRKLLEMNAKDK